MTKFKKRVSEMVILRDENKDPGVTFDLKATLMSGGHFVNIKQPENHERDGLLLKKSDWEALKDLVDTMFEEHVISEGES